MTDTNHSEFLDDPEFQSPERLVAVRGSEVLIGSLVNGEKEIKWSPYWDLIDQKPLFRWKLDEEQ